MSNTNLASGTINVFPNVSAGESASGVTRYRCLYVYNANTTTTLQNAKAYVPLDTPGAYSMIEIGSGSAGVNAVEPTIANEFQSPAGISFTDAPNQSFAIDLGNIPPLGFSAMWIRVLVDAGAPASNEPFSLVVFGDTGA